MCPQDNVLLFLRYMVATSGQERLIGLRDLCNNATMALLVMDHHRHCIHMNPTAELLAGFRLA